MHQIVFQCCYNFWMYFLFLLWFESMKFIFYQKHACECIKTSNFELTQTFFRHRAWSSMCQICFQYFYDFWMSFSALAVIRSYEVQILSKTHLWMHCNFKFWIRSNISLVTEHYRLNSAQKIKILDNKRTRFHYN